MMSKLGWSTARERGLALLHAEEFAAAQEAFSEAIKTIPTNSSLSPDLAALYLSRAACWVGLEQKQQAVDDCRHATRLHPASWEAQFQLASLLPTGHPDTAPAICAAIALLLPKPLPDPVVSLYNSIRNALSTDAGAPPALISLPSDPHTGISCVSSSTKLAAALADKQKVVIVLKSAKQTGGERYSMDDMFMEFAFSAACQRGTTLIGLGQPELRSSRSHAVFVPHGCITLVGLKLAGSGSLAAVCVATMSEPSTRTRQPNETQHAQLRMLRCCVEDYNEVGLLVTDQAQVRLAIDEGVIQAGQGMC
jgi:hypothetical protein